MLIPFLKSCFRDLGPDKSIEMLRAFASEMPIECAKGVALQLGNNDLEAWNGTRAAP